MKFKYYTRSLLPLAIALISLCPSAQASKPKTPPQQATCPLNRATYSAIGKPAFDLQFSPIVKPKIASEFVALTIQHRDRGTIATYHLGSSLGYGSYYLRDANTSIEDDRKASLKPVFFDANFQQARDPAPSAPQYLFISGLGSDDWYSDRPGNRETPVAEVMWQRSGCRPESRENS
jgi:hypothetical protein